MFVWLAGRLPRLSSTSPKTNSEMGIENLTVRLEDHRDFAAVWSMAKQAPPGSMTVIMLVSEKSLDVFENTIHCLAKMPFYLHDVVILATESVLWEVRLIVREAISNLLDYDSLHFTITSIPFMMFEALPFTAAMGEISSTNKVLLVDELGFSGLEATLIEELLSPRMMDLPVGPKGSALICANGSSSNLLKPTEALYLIPPFIASAELLQSTFKNSPTHSWSQLGASIAHQRPDGIGGIIMVSSPKLPISAKTPKPRPAVNQAPISFAVFFPTVSQLKLFSNTACKLRLNGHSVSILIYDDISSLQHPASHSGQDALYSNCRLEYDVLEQSSVIERSAFRRPGGLQFVSEWLETLPLQPNVIIGSKIDAFYEIVGNLEHLANVGIVPPPALFLPERDLANCEWMTVLTKDDWSRKFSLAFTIFH